jgi:hypothetical protein
MQNEVKTKLNAKGAGKDKAKGDTAAPTPTKSCGISQSKSLKSSWDGLDWTRGI